MKERCTVVAKEFEARRNAGFDVKWLSTDSILKQYGIEKLLEVLFLRKEQVLMPLCWFIKY